MEHLVEVLVPIACGCILPIVAIWLGVRRRMNETNARTQIALAAIEKNPDMDIEELLKKVSKGGKLLKEKLLTKLLWGCLTTLLGVGLIGFGIYLSANHLGGTDDPMTSVCFGLISLGVGIAFLINYFIGKKMLAKEIEAEEKRLTEQE
jgi:hypothetical protein